MRKAFVSMSLKCTYACKHEWCDFIEYKAIQPFFQSSLTNQEGTLDEMLTIKDFWCERKKD